LETARSRTDLGMRVRCVNCRQYKDKEHCVPFGLGWCCDANCRWQAVEKRRRRPTGHDFKTTVDNEGRCGVCGEFWEHQSHKEEHRRVVHPPNRSRKQGIRERDGKRCRFCGTTKALHTHHIIYRSERGSNAEENLITLCLGHHDKVHSNKRHWQPVLLELQRLYYEEHLFLMVGEVEARMKRYGEAS
jgi:hypothetical protein